MSYRGPDPKPESLTAIDSLNGSAAEVSVENTSNTTSSDAKVVATVAGTSAGDPIFQAVINGTQTWTWGIDNSSADSWVLSEGAALGTNNAIVVDVAGDITVGASLTAGTLIATTALNSSGTTGLDGAVTINESGAAVDFRVEGDDETHLIFADASEDKVGINVDTPVSALHIAVPSGAGASNIGNVRDRAAIVIKPKSASGSGMAIGGLSSTDVATIQGVYSDNSTLTEIALNPFGGNVGVGLTNPSTALDVDGTVTATGLNLGNETLSNYDEGTWSPSINTATNVILSGLTITGATYTRIGNTVFARIASMTGASQTVTTTNINTVVRFNTTGLPGVTNSTEFYGGAFTRASGTRPVNAVAGATSGANSLVGASWTSSGTGTFLFLSMHFSYVI